MKFLLFLVMATSLCAGKAQSDAEILTPPKLSSDSIPAPKNLNEIEGDFLYLFSDRLIESSGLELKVDKDWRNGSPYYFLSDSLNFPIHRVKFYQKNKVFFANVSVLDYCESNNCFARRMVKGKANLFYYKPPKKPSANTSSPNSLGGLIILGAASSVKPSKFANYYNLSTGDLRKMDFRNLMVDLKDNQDSMNALLKAKRSHNTGGPLLALGILACSATFIWWLSESTPGPVTPNAYRNGLLAGGVVSLTIGSLYFNKEKRLTRDSVIFYNQQQ